MVDLELNNFRKVIQFHHNLVLASSTVLSEKFAFSIKVDSLYLPYTHLSVYINACKVYFIDKNQE